MHKGNKLPGLAVCLMGLSMLLSQTAQALDGSYRGVYGNEPVTASFDNLESSVTGMLSIGSERYILQADGSGNGYSGQLHNLVTGGKLTLDMTVKEQRIQIQIKGGASPMLLELEKSPE